MRKFLQLIPFCLPTAEVESEEENLHPDAHIAHWLDLCLEWMKEGEK